MNLQTRDNIWYPSFLPFRTSEGVEFSAQWRVGGIRTKVDLRGTKINYFFRLKKGADYSTQVSSPGIVMRTKGEGGGFEGEGKRKLDRCEGRGRTDV